VFGGFVWLCPTALSSDQEALLPSSNCRGNLLVWTNGPFPAWLTHRPPTCVYSSVFQDKSSFFFLSQRLPRRWMDTRLSASSRRVREAGESRRSVFSSLSRVADPFLLGPFQTLVWAATVESFFQDLLMTSPRRSSRACFDSFSPFKIFFPSAAFWPSLVHPGLVSCNERAAVGLLIFFSVTNIHPSLTFPAFGLFLVKTAYFRFPNPLSRLCCNSFFPSRLLPRSRRPPDFIVVLPLPREAVSTYTHELRVSLF